MKSVAQPEFDFAAAAAAAELGIRRALDRAERAVPTWGDIALAFLRKYAEQHERFAGWMVVKSAALDPAFPKPPNDKAWGGPIKKAAHTKIIEFAGTTKDPNRHCNRIPVWRSLVYRGITA